MAEKELESDVVYVVQTDGDADAGPGGVCGGLLVEE
jgi:hypothetical protein